jgi:1-acyl-sn-glycerol-3-phosphate acyltransferase
MAFSSGYSSFVLRVYRWLWLGRIASRRPDIPPGALVLAAHYNGLVDGFVYGSQLPPARAVVSVQWHRSFLGRVLFPGIAVQRAKDAGKGGDNLHAFRQMTAALAAGDRLLFFPEGTSRLGLARLPIGRGTLLLLKSVRRCSPPPPIFFCAAHYHTPTRWRSHVSLGWIGPLQLPESPAADESWVTEHLLAAQTAAYARPSPRVVGLTSLGALLAAPYLPVWAVAGWLAHRIADDDNVISLWKFLAGVPLTVGALVLYTGVAAGLGLPLWLPLASLLGGALLWNQ